MDASSSVPHQAQPHGVKSFLVKKAVQLIALSFCKGGDVLVYILQWLDDDAATAVSVYGVQIGAALDDIASIPGLTVKIVREKLLYFLMRSAGLSGGVALQIADAVAATIDWLIL